ncbi:MAG: peptidoglycan-associated lipoprotein Pal [Candidatus Methylomirabilota bacterium]|nr:MAG: peptidoglycan-associated lipoprotein Pal [candidate division NC10 bacterium]
MESATQSEVKVKPPVPVQEPPAAGAPTAQQPITAGQESPLKDAFFDFDKSAIRDDARSSLNEDRQWLNANPKAQVTIEGHCDERGTAEYNLALGERRAKAAKDYLIAAGIAAKRIKTVSFGKERPFVMGHDESAWKWNRRAHFVVGK